MRHGKLKSNMFDQVQSGGSFDVDYSVVGPGEKTILEGTRERQGDYVFTAKEPGEHRFCFNNEMSTFAEKTVDFEISVRTPAGDSCFEGASGSSRAHCVCVWYTSR